jgi:antitoxin VapB
MALNIKNGQVERLLDEIVAVTGESKTECIRRSLEERKARLSFQLVDHDRSGRLLRLLESEIWPIVPPEERGRRLSREEEDSILGFGGDGV